MTRLYETGLHSFLWQDCMKQDCIHFYDKIVWDRYSSIFFMPSQHNTGTHPFFMTSQHNTDTHPFYIGMYIHICTHIYVHIYTSQKECLHIFVWHSMTLNGSPLKPFREVIFRNNFDSPQQKSLQWGALWPLNQLEYTRINFQIYTVCSSDHVWPSLTKTKATS